MLCALLLLLLLLDGTVCCCLFAAVVDDVLTFLCVRHEVSSFTETIHPPSVPPHMFVLPSLPSLFFSVVASIPRSPRATKKKKKGNEHHVFSFFHDSIRPLSPVGYFFFHPITLSIPRTAASSSSSSPLSTTTTIIIIITPTPFSHNPPLRV